MKVTPDQILDALAASRYGLSISELEAEFPDVTRRTIQSRLAELVAQERLVRDGSGPTRKYRIPTPDTEEGGEDPPEDYGDEAPTALVPRRLVDRIKFEHEREKWRKLKLANDLTEGSLVPAEDVKAEVSARYAALQAGLEALPARLKMRRPDLSAEDMAALHDEIATLSRSLRGFVMPEPEERAVAAG